MNRRESLKLRSASKNMYSENCFIDRRPIRFDALVHCTDLTQFRERQRVYFRCKLPTTVFLSIPHSHPRWMARISLQQVPWFHFNFFTRPQEFHFHALSFSLVLLNKYTLETRCACLTQYPEPGHVRL